jgi:2'-5' RNA ligase
MPPTEPESAVVVRIPVPRALDRVRARWDRAAARGVPAHVTVVYPFVPGTRLDANVRRELAAIAAAHEPFDVEFARIERFPGVVWAAPEPADAFIALTRAIVARFPDYPPYGGEHDVLIPHLTIVEADDAPLDDIATGSAAALPFRHRVTALDVLIESDEVRWRHRWRIRLGS